MGAALCTCTGRADESSLSLADATGGKASWTAKLSRTLGHESLFHTQSRAETRELLSDEEREAIRHHHARLAQLNQTHTTAGYSSHRMRRTAHQAAGVAAARLRGDDETESDEYEYYSRQHQRRGTSTMPLRRRMSPTIADAFRAKLREPIMSPRSKLQLLGAQLRTAASYACEREHELSGDGDSDGVGGHRDGGAGAGAGAVDDGCKPHHELEGDHADGATLSEEDELERVHDADWTAKKRLRMRGRARAQTRSSKRSSKRTDEDFSKRIRTVSAAFEEVNPADGGGDENEEEQEEEAHGHDRKRGDALQPGKANQYDERGEGAEEAEQEEDEEDEEDEEEDEYFEFVRIIVPPGLCGVVFKAKPTSADAPVSGFAAPVVKGFTRLPNGKRGTIENSNLVQPGSTLLAINDLDVTTLPLSEVLRVLDLSAHLEREFVFRK